MKSVTALFKIVKLFLEKNYIDLMDISNSYTKVSEKYDSSFLKEMHKYNETMLDELIENIKSDKTTDNIKVLDLACGTGFNSEYIRKRVDNTTFTLVDISKGMLDKARDLGQDSWNYIESDMISYLKSCDDESLDIVICAWAIKYQEPSKIIKEISRVLKKDGYVAVIVNLKGTLPEVRKIYPSLIRMHYKNVNKLMLELPNPLSEKTFNRWFINKSFKKLSLQSGVHEFKFSSSEELVKWITSTGALAGYDAMVDMEDSRVQETMLKLFNKKNICSITHKFVWGVYKNEK